MRMIVKTSNRSEERGHAAITGIRGLWRMV